MSNEEKITVRELQEKIQESYEKGFEKGMSITFEAVTNLLEKYLFLKENGKK